jgi:predicted amidophosphoribosyltransferase
MAWITKKHCKPCENCGNKAALGYRYCEQCAGRIKAAMLKSDYLGPAPHEVRTIAEPRYRRKSAEGELSPPVRDGSE